MSKHQLNQISINYQPKRNSGDGTMKKLKTFIDYSQTIYDVYENLEDYSPTKKGRWFMYIWV